MSSPSTTGLILLAAGASRRLGQPKQLLEYQNKTLLQHTIDVAHTIPCELCVLVLGSNAQQIEAQTELRDFRMVLNSEWKEGIAGSIRTGLSELLIHAPDVEDVLILLSDQPHLHTDFLKKLVVEHARSPVGITASSYADQIGVPAIFNRKFFDELLTLKGDKGAKKIIMKYSEQVTLIPFEGGETDIDTKEDYDQLIE